MRAPRSLLLGAFVVVLIAGCRPEIDLDPDGRQSQIDRVVVDATVDAAGVVRVEQRYTFASDDGGTVGLPDLASSVTSVIGGARNVRVDSEPVTPESGTFHPQLRIEKRHATVAYEVVGEIDRYSDIAVISLDVLPSPEDASRQDPDVRVSGTLMLPEAAAFLIEPHLHAGRDREVRTEGTVVRFSSRAGIWTATNELDVAFAQNAVPFVDQVPFAYLDTYRTSEQVREQVDRTLEDTLGSIDKGFDIARWVLTALAFGIPGIFWLVTIKALLVRLRRRRKVVGDVPDELTDPPTATDPAVVAVLEGEGTPERAAVAGTILAMAQRKEIDVQEYGDRLVVKVPLALTPTDGSDQIVVAGLREQADPEGVIEGPPVWKRRIGWWRGFRRDAVKRARDMGLVTRWMPLAPLSAAFIGTGVGAGFFVFSDPVAYLAIIFGVQALATVVSLVSGWTLTDKGWRERALWRSFARYIRHHGKLDKDVGPEGVTIWGPYLVYGAVLGESPGAARPLTP